MPKDISDSASRKKDKHSSRDLLRDSRKACDSADEFSKRKSTGKGSASDSTSSKKGEATGYSSGRKRQFTEHENCFASEYDDFDDSKRLVQNSTHVIRQHSRNGLVLPGISNKHSLVDYDDESSDSDSSSGSFPPQYPTAKAARRKSSVQVVSASVKADLNDMRQQSHKADTTVVRHVHLSSSSGKKQSSADSVNCDEKGDKKKHRHLAAELPEAESKKKDIPVKSAKRRYSKDHHGLDKCDDKEYNLNTEQTNSKKTPSVDKPEKTSAVKTVSKERDSKRKKSLDSETEVVVSNVYTEKSKAHKKSKKRELSEEQLSDDDGMQQRSRTNVPKLSDTGAAVHKKKEKSQKISDDSFSRPKASEKTDRQKKVGSHSDSINGTKVLPRGSSSVQQDGRVSKHSSDDYVHVHKKHEKEKHSSKKKPRAADDSDSNNDKKKDRSALKHDTGSQSTSCKSGKVKGKKNKDKSLHHSRNEREFSDEGQISSDSSGGRVKESKRKRKSHAATRSDSSTPVKAFQNASASSKKAVSSELCQPER